MLAIMTAFFLSAAISPLSKKTNLPALFTSTTLVGIFLASCFYYYCKLKQKEGKFQIEIGSMIREHKEIIITLFLVALTRVIQLGTTPRWDSESYVSAILNACQNFDFTLSSYVQSFRLCSHTTLGYSIFLAIGAFLNPTDVYGINMVNLVLVLFFTYFIYEILTYVFPKQSKVSMSMGTFLILAEPLACGTFGNINIDFPIMIFSIFLVFMHIRKYYVLFIFFTFILVQSKEVGVVVAFGYGCTYMLQLLIHKRGQGACKKPTKVADRSKDEKKYNIKLIVQRLCYHKNVILVVCACLSMLLYAIAMKTGRINSWSDGVQVGVSEVNKSNYLGFVPDYIAVKLKMIFLMNYYWLFTILILMCVVFAFLQAIKVRGKKNEIKENRTIRNRSNWYPIISLGGGVGALFVFNCVYVTWSNARYHYALEMGLFMTLVFLVLLFVRYKRMQQILFLGLAILCLSQAYTTVDTVTTKIFEARESGAYFQVAHPAWVAEHNKYFPMGVLKDMGVYNNQLGYMDKAYNKVLKAVQYEEGMDIVVWDESPKYNGFSISTINAYWNSKKGKRTFSENEDTIAITMIYPDNIKKAKESAKLKNKAVYINTPSYGVKENVAIEELSAYYVIGERQTVSIFMQGAVTYYELEAKGIEFED